MCPIKTNNNIIQFVRYAILKQVAMQHDTDSIGSMHYLITNNQIKSSSPKPKKKPLKLHLE